MLFELSHVHWQARLIDSRQRSEQNRTPACRSVWLVELIPHLMIESETTFAGRNKGSDLPPKPTQSWGDIVLELSRHVDLPAEDCSCDRKIGCVNLTDLLPGIFVTLASAGIIALAASMMPAVRWSRQLVREVGILAGLPDGKERNAWEERVLAHAQRLRLFQDVMPLRHKVFPWIPVFLFIGSITWAILDPRQIDGVIAEGPIMIPLGL
jgi:hypothetical protein